MMTVTDYLSMSDDDRYAEMRRATIATMNEECFDRYYKPTKNRWRDLVRVWDRVHTHNKHFIFASVIHKIFWGVYPYKAEANDKTLSYLLSLVEVELLDNREAYHSWGQWSTFKNVFEEILDGTQSLGDSGIDTHSIEHYHYLRDRALCKIEYDKTMPDDYDEYALGYQGYERIIKFLIPEAESWTFQQWGDDMSIISALKNRYGVDFSQSWESEREYERIVLLLRERECCGYSTDFLWYVSNITELPLSMACLIWPDDLVHEAARMFWDVYQWTLKYEGAGQPFKNDEAECVHPTRHFDRRALNNSWLCKAVSQWFNGRQYSGEQELQLKKALFDLKMTC